MKLIKKVLIFSFLLSTLFSFNVFAMKNNSVISTSERPSPINEKKTEDHLLNNRWTWLSDESCVRFNLPENTKREDLSRRYSMGLLPQWAENGTYEKANVKTRDTYTGQWSQSSEGIWSFEFDDKTIPVGVTKIDGVLYAFNGYGELKEGYEYYTGLKTGADGLVTANSEEFNQWLSTQYLPECTSHKEDTSIANK